MLKERPVEEDIYTIGWIDDLPKLVYIIAFKEFNLYKLCREMFFE